MKRIMPFLLLFIAGHIFAQTKEEVNKISELKKIISETNKVFLYEVWYLWPLHDLQHRASP